MYFSHSTSQADNTMNQGMASSDTYYSHSTVLPITTSTTDMTPSRQTILSNAPLSTSEQVFDHQYHHHHQPQQPQQPQPQPQPQHIQELVSQDTSLCPVLSSALDEDGSSHASSSQGGNRSGGHEAYILQLQNQLEESRHLQTQYYYRIEQLMSLVEKQTLRISELQEQLANSDTSVNCIVNASPPPPHHHHQQQQQNSLSSSYHHPIQHQSRQQQHQHQHQH